MILSWGDPAKGGDSSAVSEQLLDASCPLPEKAAGQRRVPRSNHQHVPTTLKVPQIPSNRGQWRVPYYAGPGAFTKEP